jgi:hypothetical protein
MITLVEGQIRCPSISEDIYGFLILIIASSQSVAKQDHTQSQQQDREGWYIEREVQKGACQLQCTQKEQQDTKGGCITTGGLPFP